MKNRSINFFLEDILECMEKIQTYCASINQTEFIKNELISDAVIKNLLVIDEAAKSIPDDLRDKHKDIPFKQMAGMRDILIHN